MLAELAQRFGRAAAQYDECAQLQKLVARHCAGLVNTAHTRVADIGIGTGFVARQLNHAEIIGVDIAGAMLKQARKHAVFTPLQADMQRLPLVNHCVDAVVSSLAIQWATDTQQCLSEWRRIVRPSGELVFATLVDGSLQQLHQCRAAMGLASNQFLAKDELVNAIVASGWQVKHCEQQTYTFYFADVWQLATSLKAIGAQTRTEQSAALATRRQWQTLAAHYDVLREAQGLPLSYEVMYVLAEN